MVTAFKNVKQRMQRLQDSDFGIFADHSRAILAFHLSSYLTGGDSVLLYSRDVAADHMPVLVPLSTLEKLVAAAKHADKHVCTTQTKETV